MGGRRAGSATAAGTSAAGSLGLVVKKAFIVSLVVLLVVIGVPVLVPGMAGGHCADCGPATFAAAMCFAVLSAAGAAVLGAASRRRRSGLLASPGRLDAFLLYRPPQLAFVG